ncbi:hypothetical protein MZD04_gp132 [Pseudomonas phage Psa21]|uniref:Uncharacterized protein n=1 Tax=Pseudomonas phage Psa21 TaxID=2530023 RepID=A0A481W4D7_9CAUD|nr:hypothetical protein MZD04_gp132 [Pseudomonas phage Psa21]QBJ02659.1 hypothetical protein PSA21_132 [Pseudomonas phage Psa21]
MGTFGKIIVLAIVMGAVEQVVLSISDSYRPNPKKDEKGQK